MTPTTPSTGTGGGFSVFAGVTAWVFDLDDTLYPPDTGIFAAVAARIRTYAARVLGLSASKAQAVQADYVARYGTTLRGLMVEHGVDPDHFLADVHAIDRSALRPDPRLAAALDRLPGRKFVLTSGTHAHIAETLGRLGIADRFDGAFDIVDAGYVPKPAAATYDAFLARFRLTATTAAMFEDRPDNLVVPRRLGMRTVLVVGTPPEGTEPVAVADFVTADLAGFLAGVAGAIGR